MLFISNLNQVPLTLFDGSRKKRTIFRMNTKNTEMRARVSPTVAENFRKIAASDHLEDAEATKLIISRLSDLREGSLLDALAAIPKHFFKGRPGRPPTGTVRPTGQHGGTAEHVGEQIPSVPMS
jgi:hypothetical protein